MEGELIVVSLITSIFMLAGISLLNRNWFKKQKYRDEAALLRAENKIRLKKLEKELLGSSSPKNEKIENSAPTLLTQIAPLIKNLDGEQISNLISALTGQAPGEEAEEPEGLMGLLNTIVAENPEMVTGLLQGIKEKMGPGPTGETQATY